MSGPGADRPGPGERPIRDLFAARARRAQVLARQWPFARELLEFFGKVFRFQSERLADLGGEGAPEASGLSSVFRPFLELVLREGPPGLVARARTLTESELGELLGGVLEGRSFDDPVLEFFPAVLAEPLLGRGRPLEPDPSLEEPPRNLCPACHRPPVASVLREDPAAETVRRTLVCSRCLREWGFTRVQCPGCLEERPEKLPRLSTPEIPWMRLEACDACGKYLKSVNLTENWEAEPVVDELGSIPLDLVAREHGFEKLALNRAGM